ncbi:MULTISPECIES: hypothetical protein [unclassified Spiroplasma]|uniref:hypothetical protein n=1 Tax=unclassified Spiroplasma TaxID=2637901 RepID=UPI00313BF447
MLSLKSGERLIQKPVFLKIFYLKLAIYLLLYILLLIPISNRNETFYNFFKLKSAVGEYADYEVSTIINWTFYSFLTMVLLTMIYKNYLRYRFFALLVLVLMYVTLVMTILLVLVKGDFCVKKTTGLLLTSIISLLIYLPALTLNLAYLQLKDK